MTSGDPDSVEAYRRRLTMEQPDATAESVRDERGRFSRPGARDARPMTDSEARADRDAAYAEMLHRVETAWKT